jgi:hypothetical protein
MKFRMTAALFLVALFISGFAQAQSQAGPEKSDPSSLAQIAVNVASNTKHPNLDGYVAIYVSPENWPAGLKDSDLGPFLKLKEAKPGRSAVFLFSQSKDAAIAVYFDGGTAFGITAVKAGAGGKMEDSSISGEYRPVTKEMLKEPGQEFHLEHNELSTDDGVPLPAYLVTSSAKKPA